jgi:hypothetical protein
MPDEVTFRYHGPEAISYDLGVELKEGDVVNVPAELAERFRASGAWEEVKAHAE